MTQSGLHFSLSSGADAARARKEVLKFAAAAGLTAPEQTGLAVAVSRIAASIVARGQKGELAFDMAADGTAVEIRIVDPWPNLGHARLLAQGLVDGFEGLPLGQGGQIRLTKQVSARRENAVPPPRNARDQPAAADAELDELNERNGESLALLGEWGALREELSRASRELDEINRGVLGLHAELEEKAEALRKTRELRTRLLSNVSHEFRTPIYSILGLSELLLMQGDGALNGEQRHQVELIRQGGEALLALANESLELVKMDAGKMEARPHPCELAPLFANLRGVMRPLVTRKEVSLIFELAERFPPLVTDEGKLSQILRNLISNAIKFTERGQIRVRAQGGSPGWVVLSVSDTGIGIAPEHQDEIFEEFAQIEGPLQKSVQGTGLGLPLSRRLAAALGGRIWLKSAPGQGSAFYLEVPLVHPAAQRSIEATHA
jgi:signal transduction histidine kinase